MTKHREEETKLAYKDVQYINLLLLSFIEIIIFKFILLIHSVGLMLLVALMLYVVFSGVEMLRGQEKNCNLYDVHHLDLPVCAVLHYDLAATAPLYKEFDSL